MARGVGWAPSQFTSSRAQRNARQQQRVEDFMDEEDMEEMQAGKEIVTKEGFAGFGPTEKELSDRQQVAHLSEQTYATFIGDEYDSLT